MTRILFARAAWGLPVHWGSLDDAFVAALDRVVDQGFDAIEMWAPAAENDRVRLRKLLDERGLGLAIGAATAGRDADEHQQSLEELCRHAAPLEPLAIALHSGRDTFPHADNLAIVRRAVELEEQHGLTICHETHRGRACFCTNTTLPLLQDAPAMRLNADFSHWCCVHESLLDDQPAAMERAILRSFHLHARVGFAEGPQVIDFRAPHYADALKAHLDWWDRIVDARRADRTETLVITPEFGPPPYQATDPETNQPLVDLDEQITAMREMLARRYAT